MKHNPLTEKLENLLAPSLEGMGYGLVMVRLAEAHKRRTLQIFVERLDGKSISLDDCSEVSQVASAILDVEDPIQGAYNLEVSSPGIDRPLIKLADFARFLGHQARVDLSMPLEGRKRFSGVLQALEGEDIQLRTADGKEFFLPFAQIDSAKLVLTDDLIKAHAKAAKASAEDGIAMPDAVNDNQKPKKQKK